MLWIEPRKPLKTTQLCLSTLGVLSMVEAVLCPWDIQQHPQLAPTMVLWCRGTRGQGGLLTTMGCAEPGHGALPTAYPSQSPRPVQGVGCIVRQLAETQTMSARDSTSVISIPRCVVTKSLQTQGSGLPGVAEKTGCP